MYQSALRAAEQEIQRETKHLEELEAEAEKRREAMVEAKKETSSFQPWPWLWVCSTSS